MRKCLCFNFIFLPTVLVLRTLLARLVFGCCPTRARRSGLTIQPREQVLGVLQNVCDQFRLVPDHKLFDILCWLPLIEHDHLMDTSAVHVQVALTKVGTERAFDVTPHILK
jgi:hypothetical protein